uniref:protein-glutamine gamma-glutamyltransferase n=1 Tax=Sparus aurata TaxID=8175 RepID=A0A671YJZ2_SPAAU
MDYMQQTVKNICGTDTGNRQLKLVNFEAHDNHAAHDTEGLSKQHLVVRRGRPFKIQLLFGQGWNPHAQILVLEVWLGDMSEKFQAHFSGDQFDPERWSARIFSDDVTLQSVTIHICSPVLSSVGLYHLQLHIMTSSSRISYLVGSFVLLCNPWLKDDPVYMPLDAQIGEYITSDYGVLFMGSHSNVSRRPWSFGQYEPGVLEACLQLLQVSPQHLSDKNRDYSRRADPVYLSRVICAMVNCNDDLGILTGKWSGSYKDGVRPTDWSGSADILHRWVSSNCNPVRYGQCWVFASVLCTVMRVLGIPSRVVTVFNAAHDTDSNTTIEEYYSSTGEKLNISKDSIWNFHVWVECWMRRPDLGPEFDGWQVVDPTPQERSGGIFRCGPCPVVAVQQHCFSTPYDTPFIYASVDADVVRLILRNGQVVGRKVDSEQVGQLIYTKSIGSDKPQNLARTYKGPQPSDSPPVSGMLGQPRSLMMSEKCTTYSRSCLMSGSAVSHEEASSDLEVSLNVDGEPTVGENIAICVTVTNRSGGPRDLMVHLDAQLKEYNSSAQQSFWKEQKEVHIQPDDVLKLRHTIPSSEHESVLAGDDMVNVAVVVKDVRAKERVLDTQEFSMSSPQITIEIEGGDSIEMRKEYTAQVSFTNTFPKTLNRAVLTVEGFGLLQDKQEARLTLLQPGDKIEKKVSITATSPGTKVLIATFSHSNSPSVVSRCFHKVSITRE